MNTVAKLAVFAAAVAGIFGGALAVGATAGPIGLSGSGGHDVHTGNSAQ